MIDQALGLRALATYNKPLTQITTPSHAPRIAVTGGKGGVGTTLFTSNLALCGAKAGRRVVFVEADSRFSPFRLAHHMGASPLREASTVDSLFPTLFGVQVLSWDEWGKAIHTVPTSLWSDPEQAADLVILDMGSASFENTLLRMETLSHCVIVTTPDIYALAESYKKIKCLRLQNPKVAISVIFNAVSGGQEVTRSAEQLENMVQTFLHTTLYYLGTLPHDRLLTDANPIQSFVLQERPRSPIAKSIRNIYQILAQ